MKAQNTNLSFNKNTMVELNNNELLEVNGGSTTACWILIGYLLK